MNKIVIAADSFKGCLTSQEVAESISAGVRKVYPHCNIVCINIADGGEGFCQALAANLNGNWIECCVHDPLMRPINAQYVLLDKDTAIIECARASGLTLLTPNERNPLYTSTYGTGELIKDALYRGCKHIVIGLGGSATNDGGCGMLLALGYQFYDYEGHPIQQQGGQMLNKIARIDTSQCIPELSHCSFTIGCDVENPLIGPNGATYVYGPQKGGTSESLDKLEQNMRHWCKITSLYTHKDLSSINGGGAAGGLAGACIAYLHANMVPGINYVLDSIGFEKLIKDADLIITGEGKIDQQTLTGKAPQGILKRAQKHAIPTIALVGSITPSPLFSESGFCGIFPIQSGPSSLEEAMERQNTTQNLSRTIEQLLLFYKSFHCS